MRDREPRGPRFVDELTQDLRFAVRALTRDRGFAVTAILVLALGIGVNNMMFTILYAHTMRSLPIADAERVVYVSTRDERDTDRGLSWPEFDEAREAVRTTELAAFVSGPAALADSQRAPERVERSHVTSGVFDVLGTRPVMGRVFRVADDRAGAAPVALLGERAWRSSFGGDAAVVGRSVLIDGAPATIVGVLPERSGFPGNAVVWQPMSAFGGLDRADRTARTLRVIGRVREEHTVDEGMAEIRAVADRIGREHPDTSRGIRAHVAGINDRYLGRASDPAWEAFTAVGFLVLFIAAANVAHLLIGRGVDRAREVAIRTSLGASRGRIVRLLLVESVLLAAAGGILGLGLAAVGIRLFKQGIPEGTLPYWLDYAIDARVLAALAAVSALTVLAAGTVPAFHACRTDPNVTLKSGGSATAAASSRWSRVFLVAELALGVVMLANLALAMRVATARVASDAALSAEDVVTASVSLSAARYRDAPARLAFHDALEAALTGMPGFSRFATASALPVYQAPERHLVAEGRDAADAIAARQVLISDGYFAALGLFMEQGRAFTSEDGEAGRPRVIVNARLAERLFPGESAVGRRVAVVTPQLPAPPAWHTVVGVAPVVRQRPQAEPEAVFYVPIRVSPPALASVIVHTDRPLAEAAALMRERLRQIDPATPFYDVATLGGAVRRAEWNGRLSTLLLTTLTAIAVVLAAAGLFAVVNRTVATRRREIGLRVALGASAGDVSRLVLRGAAGYVAYGGVAGLAGAAAWDAAFGTSARSQVAVPGIHLADPVVLLLVAAALGAVATIASLAPIRRALGVDPAVALRHD